MADLICGTAGLGFKRTIRGGFTLIELSIVLVIIGLIVGGVLVGQDLIRSATVRAQITQIEKFQTATNTFYGKYGFLPGDIKDPDATNFGFLSRGGTSGQGDGNGKLYSGSGAYASLWYGEITVFWRDLSTAGLIPGMFTTATFTNPGALTTSSSPAIKDFAPAAAIDGNLVSVFNGECTPGCQGLGLGPTTNPALATNFYSISNVTSVSASGSPTTANGLTVRQAYDIDRKIDDGIPVTGRVLAVKVTSARPTWTDGTFTWNLATAPAGPTAGSSTTCCDTDTGPGEQYSIKQNGGANVNCSLSFRFQ